MDQARLSIRELTAPSLGPISFSLASRSCVMLSGPSGAGKTRLLRCIADLDPNHGEVRLDGTPREAIAPSQWRRQVGLLPAESHWWADRVGLHFRSPCPPDLVTDLGLSVAMLEVSPDRLSSGERQRFALARLLANQPAVLLLDEPTAHLDASSARRVEAVTRRYRETSGASVLWVSHDLDQIGRVGMRHWRMGQGRIEQYAS